MPCSRQSESSLIYPPEFRLLKPRPYPSRQSIGIDAAPSFVVSTSPIRRTFRAHITEQVLARHALQHLDHVLDGPELQCGSLVKSDSDARFEPGFYFLARREPRDLLSDHDHAQGSSARIQRTARFPSRSRLYGHVRLLRPR